MSLSLNRARRRLANSIQKPGVAPAPLRFKLGTIAAYSSGDTFASVTVDNDTVDAPFIGGTPRAGDLVGVLLVGGSSPVILGAASTGGGAGGMLGYLIAAQDPTSVLNQEWAGGGTISPTYRAPMYLLNDTVLAYGLDGETFPRFRMFADTGAGAYWFDGSADPQLTNIAVDGGANLWYATAPGTQGLELDSARSTMRLCFDVALLDLVAGASGNAFMRVDATDAKIYVRAQDAQTEPCLVVADTTGVHTFTVLSNGSVDAAGPVRPGNYATVDRPTGADLGAMIFDTDLVRPIWSDGAGGWVDATGTSV